MTSRAMRDAFLEQIWQSMERDASLFFVSADFGSPVLDKIRADYPDRFVNVGIAEQNLINVSAGLALEGYTVFAYAIASFITMRCYEQTRVNLALLSEVRPMNVNLIGVGAGYSYAMSGPTHQCYEDITLMRALPNFQLLSPADHITAGQLFTQCISQSGPKYLRFDAQTLPVLYTEELPDGQAGFHAHCTGQRICLVATGYMTHTALEVAEQLAKVGERVGVIDLFNLTHCDLDKLEKMLSPYAGLISLEEGFRGRGGLDALLVELNTQRDWGKKLLGLGVEPGYRFELGSRMELHEQVGIGVQSALQRIRDFTRTL
jgi:transketolase